MYGYWRRWEIWCLIFLELDYVRLNAAQYTSNTGWHRWYQCFYWGHTLGSCQKEIRQHELTGSISEQQISCYHTGATCLLSRLLRDQRYLLFGYKMVLRHLLLLIHTVFQPPFRNFYVVFFVASRLRPIIMPVGKYIVGSNSLSWSERHHRHLWYYAIGTTEMWLRQKRAFSSLFVFDKTHRWGVGECNWPIRKESLWKSYVECDWDNLAIFLWDRRWWNVVCIDSFHIHLASEQVPPDDE